MKLFLLLFVGTAAFSPQWKATKHLPEPSRLFAEVKEAKQEARTINNKYTIPLEKISLADLPKVGG